MGGAIRNKYENHFGFNRSYYLVWSYGWNISIYLFCLQGDIKTNGQQTISIIKGEQHKQVIEQVKKFSHLCYTL